MWKVDIPGWMEIPQDLIVSGQQPRDPDPRPPEGLAHLTNEGGWQQDLLKSPICIPTLSAAARNFRGIPQITIIPADPDQS